MEDIIKNLKGPLEVTYTVDPREVLQNLSAWEPVTMKEVKSGQVAVERLYTSGQL